MSSTVSVNASQRATVAIVESSLLGLDEVALPPERWKFMPRHLPGFDTDQIFVPPGGYISISEAAPGAASGCGTSAIMQSVVRISDATDAAFCRAWRVTTSYVSPRTFTSHVGHVACPTPHAPADPRGNWTAPTGRTQHV